MTALLDTHFLLWVLGDSPRLQAYPWLPRYQPWTLSPVSLLEIQYLQEVGRVEIATGEFLRLLSSDSRFILDDISAQGLFQRAMPLYWTRDPFDRLLAAHSLARRIRLCSVDAILLRHHELLVAELTGRQAGADP